MIPLLMLLQLLKIQIGVMKVVSSTKYSEIPSIPMWKWQKLKLLNSCTNWNCDALLSNSPHNTIETKKFTIDVTRAIRFIRESPASVPSAIGSRANAPTRGINNSAVSIVLKNSSR